MYIETSRPQHPGDKATLNSEILSYTGHQCMNFYYHMYGPTVGTLRIWILPNGTVNPIPLWELKNNQGNQWNQGRIALPRQTGTFMVSSYLIHKIQSLDILLCRYNCFQDVKILLYKIQMFLDEYVLKYLTLLYGFLSRF